MDEKFERVGSSKMCVWRKIEKCRRRKKIKVTSPNCSFFFKFLDFKKKYI